MVRLKGANSDYEYSSQTDGIVDKTTERPELFLQIFICPYDMPSRIEKPHNGKWCIGTDQNCPHEGNKSGHALINLHQKEGISLITDNNNKLSVTQEGNIELIPASGKVIIKRDKH